MDKKFILVKDPNVVSKLKNAGFVTVYESSDHTLFLNNSPANFNFDALDKTKLSYTNNLYF